MNYNIEYDFFGCSKFALNNCNYTINNYNDKFDVMKRLVCVNDKQKVAHR